MEKTKYYIYALKDPLTKLIRYIGLTQNPDTRLKTHLSCKVNRGKYDWITSLKKQNLKPELVILKKILSGFNEYPRIVEYKTIKRYRNKGSELFNYPYDVQSLEDCIRLKMYLK